MSDRHPGAFWERGDDDVPVPLHPVPHEGSAETPVPVDSPAVTRAEAIVESHREAIAREDTDPAALDLADGGDMGGPLPAAAWAPELASLGSIANRSAPRWSYALAVVMLAGLCALSFVLGWQQGAVAGAGSVPDPGIRSSATSFSLSGIGVETASDAATRAVIWDTGQRATTGYV